MMKVLLKSGLCKHCNIPEEGMMIGKFFGTLFGLFGFIIVVIMIGSMVTARTITQTSESYESINIYIDDLKIGTTTAFHETEEKCQQVWNQEPSNCKKEDNYQIEWTQITSQFPLLIKTGAEYAIQGDRVQIYWPGRGNYAEVVGEEVVVSLSEVNYVIQLRTDDSLRLMHDVEHPVIIYKYVGLAGQLKTQQVIIDLCDYCRISEAKASAYTENGSGSYSSHMVFGTGESSGGVEWHGEENLTVYGEVYSK